MPAALREWLRMELKKLHYAILFAAELKSDVIRWKTYIDYGITDDECKISSAEQENETIKFRTYERPTKTNIVLNKIACRKFYEWIKHMVDESKMLVKKHGNDVSYCFPFKKNILLNSLAKSIEKLNLNEVTTTPYALLDLSWINIDNESITTYFRNKSWLIVLPHK